MIGLAGLACSAHTLAPLAFAFEQLHRSGAAARNGMVEIPEQFEYAQNPDHARDLCRGPGLKTLNSPLRDAGLMGQFSLCKRLVYTATADALAEFGQNRIIGKQL